MGSHWFNGALPDESDTHFKKVLFSKSSSREQKAEVRRQDATDTRLCSEPPVLVAELVKSFGFRGAPKVLTTSATRFETKPSAEISAISAALVLAPAGSDKPESC